MNKFKSEKGAITLLVLITMLFIVSFLITMYIITANKVEAQIERTEQIKETYNNVEDAESVYNSYFGGDVINIYTVEQLLQIGSKEKIVINGKVYTFTGSATYVLMEDLVFDVDNYTSILGTNTDWTPIGNTTYNFEGNGHTITVTHLNNSTFVYNESNAYSKSQK